MRGHRGVAQYIIARCIVISYVSMNALTQFLLSPSGVPSPGNGITSGTPLQNLNPSIWPRLPPQFPLFKHTTIHAILLDASKPPFSSGLVKKRT